MKYRISSDYQQASGPPRWEFQDNIVLIPKNIAERTQEVLGKDAAGTGRQAEYAAKMIEHAQDEYFSRMGWFTRTHPVQLPSGRILEVRSTMSSLRIASAAATGGVGKESKL